MRAWASATEIVDRAGPPLKTRSRRSNDGSAPASWRSFTFPRTTMTSSPERRTRRWRPISCGSGPIPEIRSRPTISPLVMLPMASMTRGEIVGRDRISGIGPLPQLIGLHRLVRLSGDDVIVVRGNVKLLQLAGALPSFERLLRVLNGGPALSTISVALAQARISHGEVGIYFNSASIKRDCAQLASFCPLCFAQAECLERFQR